MNAFVVKINAINFVLATFRTKIVQSKIFAQNAFNLKLILFKNIKTQKFQKITLKKIQKNIHNKKFEGMQLKWQEET